MINSSAKRIFRFLPTDPSITMLHWWGECSSDSKSRICVCFCYLAGNRTENTNCINAIWHKPHHSCYFVPTPVALQMRLALCFSRIDTVLGLLSSSIIVGGTEIIWKHFIWLMNIVWKYLPTTSRWPVIEIIGSVFTCILSIINQSVKLHKYLKYPPHLTHVVSLVLCLNILDL